MNKILRLTEGDRAFFRLVSEAAFSNPFSDERKETDLRIIGRRAGENLPDERALKTMTETVAARVAKLEAEGFNDMRRLAEEDREILRVALLFDAFHRFIDVFDKLILDQIKAGDKPLPVPFAPSARELMTGRGFTADAF
ncbi:MAG: sigma-54-dependent Fis family transcriptional regulator, partial [Kiritimatiellia bacterium]